MCLVRASIILYSVAILLASCRSEDHERPEPDTPEVDYGISFAPSTPAAIEAVSSTGSITFALIRANATTAPMQSVALAAEAGRAKVSVPDSVCFAYGQAMSNFVLDYDITALDFGESDDIDIVAGGVRHNLSIIRADSSAPSVKGVYIRNFERTEVDITINGDTYTVTGSGLSRTITLDNGHPYVHNNSGIVDIEDAKAILDASGGWTPYIFSSASTFDSEEGRFNLAIADSTLHPSIEYLLLNCSTDWADSGVAIFTDRWVLPTVSINAELLDPDSHRWRVWLQESRSTPGLYRIIDPYRGDSPLSEHNSAAAGAMLFIDATTPHEAKIYHTNPVMYNPDLGSIAITGNGTFVGDTLYIKGLIVLSDD